MNATIYAQIEAEKARQQFSNWQKEQENSYNSQKNIINTQKNQAVTNINNQRPQIEAAAEDNARQQYINKMLGQKQMKQTLSQAGLDTSGVVGSAYGNIENQYAGNLNKILVDKASANRNLDTQISNTNVQYDTNLVQLDSDYSNKKLALMQQANQLEYSRYSDAYNRYIAKQQAEQQLKQYNEQAKQQAKQQAIQRALAERQYNDQLRQQAWENAHNIQVQNSNTKANEEFFTDGAEENINSNIPIKNVNAAENFAYSLEKVMNNQGSKETLGAPIAKKLDKLVNEGKITRDEADNAYTYLNSKFTLK